MRLFSTLSVPHYLFDGAQCEDDEYERKRLVYERTLIANVCRIGTVVVDAL